MKQLIQSLKNGETLLEEVPAPLAGPGEVLIRTSCSLVSKGTEKMLVDFGKAGWISKARQQPDKVKQVLDKIAAEGLLPTLENVFRKLDQPIPLGYCNVGQVIAVGSGITDLRPGDRVVSNGSHAEIVAVPRNLVARIPDSVSDEQAVFTVIGAIGLQGIRLCEPSFGETIVVMGLGLIGLITAQLLRAQGCRVIGIDIDSQKTALAASWGIHTLTATDSSTVPKEVMTLTNGIGADGVIITASAQGNELITQAATMSRKRGRIILVGVVGLHLNRADFYHKELRFQVSCSYGPGRYDEAFEQKGLDYPIAYVRWTEQRNFEAILQAIADGGLKVDDLISERVPFQEYHRIYQHLDTSSTIASILVYDDKADLSLSNSEVSFTRSAHSSITSRSFTPTSGHIGIIGAGNFTKMTVMPILKRLRAPIKTIISAGGLNAAQVARTYGIPFTNTDAETVWNDPDISATILTTRHNRHAEEVIRSLETGKHVFVEKPLAISRPTLEAVAQAYFSAQTHQDHAPSLTVGFNRRWSPHSLLVKSHLKDQAVNIIASMNAGFIPAGHWVHDLEVGGGRILGEACHMIDLCSFLANAPVDEVMMSALGNHPESTTDNAVIVLKMSNGSQATIHYFSNGSRAYPKERVEVHQLERSFVIDNFRHTQAYGVRSFRTLKTKIDKGHQAQFKTWIERLQHGGEELIPFNSLYNTSEAALAALESLHTKQWVSLKPS